MTNKVTDQPSTRSHQKDSRLLTYDINQNNQKEQYTKGDVEREEYEPDGTLQGACKSIHREVEDFQSTLSKSIDVFNQFKSKIKKIKKKIKKTRRRFYGKKVWDKQQESSCDVVGEMYTSEDEFTNAPRVQEDWRSV